MCGRFTLTSPPEAVASEFGLGEVPLLGPRFNIAPGQDVAVVRFDSDADERVLEMRRWGLVPAWAKDPKIGNRLINARAETVAEKPSFRSAFRKRRCLLPADGFFEWTRGSAGRQPFHFSIEGSRPFAMAGLFERWQGPDGPALATCTIVTAPANEHVAPVHPRMPLILGRDDWDAWLDPDGGDTTSLRALLEPRSPNPLSRRPVDKRVNDPRNDDPACIEPPDSGPLFGGAA